MKFLATAIPKPETSPEEMEENAAEFIAAVEKMLEDQSQPYFRKAKGFSPSSTNDCARLAVYLLEGVELTPSIGARLRRIFDNGHSLEDRINKYIEPYIVEREKRIISEPVPISGFIDFIVEYEGQKYILEIKSINDRGYEARKQMRRPKDEHLRQIQLYMHVTGIHQGIVWYENKNDQEWLPLYVTYDAEYVNGIMERYGRIYDIHLKGEIPKRPHRQTTKVCQGCDARERCWSDDREGTEKL